jgi:hypothetical protein
VQLCSIDKYPRSALACSAAPKIGLASRLLLILALEVVPMVSCPRLRVADAVARFNDDTRVHRPSRDCAFINAVPDLVDAVR